VSGAAAREHPLDIFLVAGEASGDHLGAALMKKLRARLAGEAAGEPRFRGVGGPEMAAQGLASLFPMDDVTAMGCGAVLRKLPLILRRLRETVAAIRQSPPDILVLIDSPDFNTRVAGRVRRALPNLAIVKYVSPTVWAWRPGRARKLKPLVDHILALFPFEPEVHKKLGGPPTSYVGHPLLERLGELRPSRDEARARDGDPPLVLVLPGSRPGEIRRLAAVFGEAIGRIAKSRPIDLVLPTLPGRLEQVAAAVKHWPLKPRIVTGEAEKYSAFRRARAALAASGTVTLELALAHVPTVAGYRVSMLEAPIARALLRGISVIMPNIVLNENVVPEFLQENCTAEKLAAALLPLLADTPERRRQLAGFTRLDEIFSLDAETASQRAARIVLEVHEKKRKLIGPPRHSQ
jgi:lipid-A-disaccharide synthase